MRPRHFLADFSHFWPFLPILPQKMDPRAGKSLTKVVGLCLYYILTKFYACRSTYVVTGTPSRVKIHLRDKIFDPFGHFLPNLSGFVLNSITPKLFLYESRTWEPNFIYFGQCMWSQHPRKGKKINRHTRFFAHFAIFHPDHAIFCEKS